MRNNQIITEHLGVALNATGESRPFLTYLIQMAILESHKATETVEDAMQPLPDNLARKKPRRS